MKRIKIGVLGAGSFANRFIPLWQAHPLVEDVYLAEKLEDRRAAAVAQHGIRTSYASYEELLGSDADAIGLFSQRWTHGPQAVAALRAGKHVYSAVPAAISLAELEALVSAVRETGLVYMMGETSYYLPTTVFCRKRFREGAFGRFVYAEAGYYHDMEHGFYPPYQGSNGPDWKRFASFPPMLYPSHSVGMILAITDARMTHVSCLGYTDDHQDGVFDRQLSHWQNAFSNETALFRTSDGGMCRTNEFRRVATGGVRCSVHGTLGAYEEQPGAKMWINHDRSTVDLREPLTCGKVERKPKDWAAQKKQGAQDDFFSGLAPVHESDRLPDEFLGKPNGHGGSHQFLADDFAKACAQQKLPPVHVWTAAKYCAPGIVAHQSAQQQGQMLPIPDFGAPPADASFAELA
ncbi:MAG: Gfo/Idh/MocA family oxidoreductase [Kiritimatiellae bacterium]|nr:Gfo/Idh/MocA family oxidoreductase [Kiritimatiellia bacterium]